MNPQPAQFIELVSEEGCRHVVRVASIQLISDVDVLRDSTVIVVAGRPIVVPVKLDEILDMISGRHRMAS